MDQTRQIQRLRFSIRTFRQYALKVLDELADQIDALAGDQPAADETGENWREEIGKMITESKAKK